MTEDARLYRVRWEIKVEAEMPLAAAEKARHYQTRPGTTATVFEVAEIRPYAIRRYGDPGTTDKRIWLPTFGKVKNTPPTRLKFSNLIACLNAAFDARMKDLSSIPTN